jgi:hypothetical protein
VNREEIHREFDRMRKAFHNIDGNFKNIDIHIGEHLRRMTKLQSTVDELYLNAMTRDRMWTALMELLYRKGTFTKEEYDTEINLLNEAIEKAVKEDEAKKKEAEELAKGKVTVLSEVPEIPVVK